MNRKIAIVLAIGIAGAFLGLLQANPAQDAASPAGHGAYLAQQAPVQYAPKPAGMEEAVEEVPAEAAEAQAVEFDLDEAALAALAKLDEGIQLTDAEKALLERYADRQHGVIPIDNIGGPDGADYYFVDNVSPDTATYAWIELDGDPQATWINAWSSHDDGYSSTKHPLGFSFPFYGASYDSFRVGTNGHIQFITTSTSLSNVCLPSSNVNQPAIFPFWDDLHLDRGGIATGIDVVGFRNFGDYTVIEFDSIGYYSTSCVATLRFQVILYNSGKIKLQYHSIPIPASCINSQTIGIQSNGAPGSPALNYICNATGIVPSSGLAIWFYQFVYDHNFATSSIISPAGRYPTNTPITVTARFTNVGMVSEGSPVKYSFNGGPVQTEATAVLGPYEFEDHSFAAQITTPATPGAYTLTVWSDLATDQVRSNDTMRVTIGVGGDDCSDAMLISGAGPDSLYFNNCGANSDNPGQPCGASGQDMVFRIEVPNGYTLLAWQGGGNTIIGRHTLRWGGACPGENLISCTTTESSKLAFVNNTGTTQTAWITVGVTTSPGTCGNLGVAWTMVPIPANDDCGNPMILEGMGPDSVYVSNCGATSDTPGQPCGASGQDLVFRIDVPDGYSLQAWEGGGNSIIGRHTLRWGGVCPGENVIGCTTTETTKLTFANNTGTTQTAWITVGVTTSPGTCGNLGVAWVMVPIPANDDCGNPMILSGMGPDSLSISNCGASSDTPGQPCGASGQDLVFRIDVPNGLILRVWQSANTIIGRHTLRWGGACPGDNLAGCTSTEATRLFFTNSTGVTQTAWITVGVTTSPGTCGNLGLGWFMGPPLDGESCGNAIALTAPAEWDSVIVTGSTVDFTSDGPDTCDFTSSTSPDVFYSLTLNACRRITMRLQETVSTGDMHIAVYEAGHCGQHAIMCNDDRGNFPTLWWENPAQRPGYSLSSFVGGELPAGTYYIRVAKYGSGSGPYHLTVFDNGPCGCDIVCPGGSVPEVAEDRYQYTFRWTDPDGGCTDSVPSYQAITLGQTVCGLGSNYVSRNTATTKSHWPDNDWYEFNALSSDTIRWTVTAEFRSYLALYNGCVLVVADSADACSTKTIQSYLVQGTYSAVVRPLRTVGNPMPSTYIATLAVVGGCAPDTVDNLTVLRSPYPSTDTVLRWAGDAAFSGTYSVYYNASHDPNFPGSWVLLQSNIAPAAQMSYIDTGVVGPNARRFYAVVSVCP